MVPYVLCSSVIDRWYYQSVPTHGYGGRGGLLTERYPQSIKNRYKILKQNLKFLVYENECFQETLRLSQRHLIKALRDRSFLLDRLLNHGRMRTVFSDSDDGTDSSEDELSRSNPSERTNASFTPTKMSESSALFIEKTAHICRKKKKISKWHEFQESAASTNAAFTTAVADGHMTSQEVERHLESRQSYLELLPQKAPPTVPTEMFSNDPAGDKTN